MSKLFMPNGSNDLTTGVSMYAIFTKNNQQNGLYAERSQRLAKTLKTDGTADLSHRDFGCLTACMLFYGQLLKVKAQKCQDNTKKVTQIDHTFKHVCGLYRQFFDEFAQTVSVKNRSKYQRMLRTNAPLNKLLLV